MRAVLRVGALLLSLALVPATPLCGADDARANKGKSKNKSAAVRAQKSVPQKLAGLKEGTEQGRSALAAHPMPRGAALLFPAAPSVAFPAAPAQTSRATKEPFALRPMPSTTGTLGLFTVDSGYLLPRRAFAITSYANKISRMPGNTTILTFGTAVSFGITDRFNVHLGWEPYRFTHIGAPSQLSLRTPTTNPPYPDATNPTIFRGLTAVPGSAPGYVEEFPFASRNAGGVGEVVIGFKLGPFSEWRGHWLSLAIRSDLFIPTHRSFSDLLDNGTQTGQLSWQGSVSASRTWWKDRIVSSSSLSYRITRDPRANRVRMFQQADVLRLGGGTIFLPKHRVQPMTETVITIYTGQATQNTTFGARDPIDSVWGVRLYPWTNLAVDIGYRRTGNLRGHGNKNGFVIKVGAVHWREK